MVDSLDGCIDKKNSASKDDEAKSETALAANPNTEQSQQHENRTKKLITIVKEWARFAGWPWIRKPDVKRALISSTFWTALATVAIAVLTAYYTHYAKKQWQTMGDQLTSMNGSLFVQKNVVRLEHGSPDIKITWLGWYRSEKEHVLWADMKIQNVQRGKAPTTPATALRVASRLEFLDFEPKETQYNFIDNDFGSTRTDNLNQNPTTLKFSDDIALYKTFYNISPENYASHNSDTLYLWGKIRYWDFIGDIFFVKFHCYVPAAKVFGAPASQNDRSDEGGYTAAADTNCTTEEPQPN